MAIRGTLWVSMPGRGKWGQWQMGPRGRSIEAGGRTPDALAQQQIGLGELDGERDAPVHRLVEVHRPVGREDAQPLVTLELGQHRVDLRA